MNEHIHVTSDDAFEADVLKSEIPVLVDFWAEWCGPCKVLMPTLEEVAKEYQGRVKVVKVNVDDNSEAPAKYGVRGIPNLILFKDGDIAGSKVGAMSKSELTKFLDEHI